MRAPPALLGMLAAATLLAGCGAATATAPPPPKALAYSLPDAPTTLDPAYWAGPGGSLPLGEIYDTLIEYGSGTTLRPALARSYRVSPDGLTYTFQLRPGVRFSNGDPLTAQDVIFSLSRSASGDAAGGQPAPYSFAFSDVVGYRRWHNVGKAPPAGMPGLLGITAPAQDEVRIRLKAPEPYFLSALALTSAAILDAAVVQREGAAFGLHPVGTGPYMVGSFDPGRRLTLVANPSSWRGPARVAKVVVDEGVAPGTALQRYQAGRYDFVFGPLPASVHRAVTASPALSQQYAHVPGERIVYLAFNTTRPPFDNVAMRQAVNDALHKAAIVQAVRAGRAGVLTQPLPAGVPGYDPALKDPYHYDPQRAKALLAQAHYGGQPVTLIFPQQARYLRLAQIVQQELQAVGIKVQLRSIQHYGEYWYQRSDAQGNWNIAWSAWSPDYPDAQDFLQYLLTRSGDGATNSGDFYDPRLEALVAAADSLPPAEAAKRLADLRQAEQIAVQDAPWAFLYVPWDGALIKPWLLPRRTPGDLSLYLNPLKGPELSRIY